MNRPFKLLTQSELAVSKAIVHQGKLGNPEVSAIGLGCMSMRLGYHLAGDKQQMIFPTDRRSNKV